MDDRRARGILLLNMNTFRSIERPSQSPILSEKAWLSHLMNERHVPLATQNWFFETMVLHSDGSVKFEEAGVSFRPDKIVSMWQGIDSKGNPLLVILTNELELFLHPPKNEDVVEEQEY